MTTRLHLCSPLFKTRFPTRLWCSRSLKEVLHFIVYELRFEETYHAKAMSGTLYEANALASIARPRHCDPLRSLQPPFSPSLCTVWHFRGRLPSSVSWQKPWIFAPMRACVFCPGSCALECASLLLVHACAYVGTCVIVGDLPQFGLAHALGA